MPATEQTTRETRDSQSRKKVWTPPSKLYTPPAPEGYSYRWVRCQLRGDQEDDNVIDRIRQFYEPVKATDLSEKDKGNYGTLETGKHAGVIRSGDLILMKVPNEVKEQRAKYYEDRTKAMQRSTQQELMENQNSAMPISDESKSTLTKGRADFQD
jgi:hypothetical protein